MIEQWVALGQRRGAVVGEMPDFSRAALGLLTASPFHSPSVAYFEVLGRALTVELYNVRF